MDGISRPRPGWLVDGASAGRYDTPEAANAAWCAGLIPRDPAPPTGGRAVKIERIRPFLVDRCLLVRVYTDAGIVGTGEAGLWAHHKLVYEAIEQLGEYYVGKDARTIEHHFQTVSRDTHFQGAVLSAAMSSIDIALWDILGKSLGKPVYQLLGGKLRDKVKVFGNVGGATLDERARQAQDFVAQGYTSLRTVPFF